jgi:hypothetical protein
VHIIGRSFTAVETGLFVDFVKVEPFLLLLLLQLADEFTGVLYAGTGIGFTAGTITVL